MNRILQKPNEDAGDFPGDDESFFPLEDKILTKETESVKEGSLSLMNDANNFTIFSFYTRSVAFLPSFSLFRLFRRTSFPSIVFFCLELQDNTKQLYLLYTERSILSKIEFYSSILHKKNILFSKKTDDTVCKNNKFNNNSNISYYTKKNTIPTNKRNDYRTVDLKVKK
jgi:hypothetical protein